MSVALPITPNPGQDKATRTGMMLQVVYMSIIVMKWRQTIRQIRPEVQLDLHRLGVC